MPVAVWPTPGSATSDGRVTADCGSRTGPAGPGYPGHGGRRTGPVRRPPAGLLVGLAILAAFLVAVVAGAMPGAGDPFAQDLLNRNLPPSAAHWAGTDNFGRDVLARMLHGAQLTLIVGLGGVVSAFLFGAVLGLVALAAGPWLTMPVYGMIDFIRALPNVLLALVLIVALGPALSSVVIALGIAFSPFFAYVARAAWRREMAADYVTVARTFGAGRLAILWRHALPNILGALITLVAVILPRCIVTESVLSFLGLGVSPDTPTWGRMIADATPLVERAPHAVFVPVVALSLLTLALALLGNHVRRRLDPLRAGDPRQEPAP